MSAYYNEIDPYAVQWMRNLITEGLIAKGIVDDRSISDVKPSELAGFIQCHFFAGIGGWSHALRLAGWGDDRPVWTGSCPCQPFSTAGKGAGTTDERHLWPHWFHLIRAVRPQVVFGEQVEAAINHGWLDLVQDDLEGEGYAFAPVGLPAACVGAPHIRQRLWFVADSRLSQQQRWDESQEGLQHRRGDARGEPTSCCSPLGADGILADNNNTGLERRQSVRQRTTEQSPWQDGLVNWLPCRDGKARPVEPGTFPLAHGIPNRVGRLRAYGNAIVPQVAAEVIRAYMECQPK